MEAVNQSAAFCNCQIILNCVVNVIILLLQNEPAPAPIDTITYRAACDQTLQSQWERGDQDVSQTRYWNVFGSCYREMITANSSYILSCSGSIVQGLFGGFWWYKNTSCVCRIGYCLSIALHITNGRNSVSLLAPVPCSEKELCCVNTF